MGVLASTMRVVGRSGVIIATASKQPAGIRQVAFRWALWRQKRVLLGALASSMRMNGRCGVSKAPCWERAVVGGVASRWASRRFHQDKYS